jgi:putative transposase
LTFRYNALRSKNAGQINLESIKKNSWLDDKISSELYPYISKILVNHNCNTLQIGSTGNHIHILFEIAKNLSSGKVVEEIKISSSKWIKDPKYKEFYWQCGYGAFSVSSSKRHGF